MKKTFTVICMLALACVQPANADVFVKAHGGVLLNNSADVFDNLAVYGGAIGNDFGSTSIELEVLYMNPSVTVHELVNAKPVSHEEGQDIYVAQVNGTLGVLGPIYVIGGVGYGYEARTEGGGFTYSGGLGAELGPVNITGRYVDCDELGLHDWVITAGMKL